MKTKQQARRKRFMIELLNFAMSASFAAVFFYATMKTNFLLIANWICRADLAERISIYGNNPSFDEDFNMLASELETISQSSAYANILVNSSLLASIIIIIVVCLIIMGLVWLGWQNFKRLVVIARSIIKNE